MITEQTSLYRLTIPDGGSEYWRVIDRAGDGVQLACLGVGRKDEYILVDASGTITEATRREFVGTKPKVTPFTR